jgi:hypothetical protein
MDTNKEKVRVIKMRGFLELKPGGEFISTLHILKFPEMWKDLIPADRRLVKRYAAKIAGGNLADPDDGKDPLELLHEFYRDKI